MLWNPLNILCRQNTLYSLNSSGNPANATRKVWNPHFSISKNPLSHSRPEVVLEWCWQIGHWKGFSDEWTFKCLVYCLYLLLLYSHWGHRYLKIPAWVSLQSCTEMKTEFMDFNWPAKNQSKEVQYTSPVKMLKWKIEIICAYLAHM